MRRGEVWTVSGGADYAKKPRPAVIIQSDRFDATESITICTLTTTEREASFFRLEIRPTPANGLTQRSWLMVDKVSTVPRTKIGRRLGHLEDEEASRLNQALIVFLGLATPVRANNITGATT